MFVGVFRVAFAIQKNDIPDGRAIKGFCEKLMKRFKVVARSNYSVKRSEILWIAFTTIAEKEEILQRLFEQVIEMCDSSELGRVYDQIGIIQPLDDFFEEEDSPSQEYEP